MLNKNIISKLVFYIITTLLLLITFIPYSVSEYYNYLPEILLSFVFYFYTYQKEPKSYLYIFIITFIYDANQNNIMGFTAVSYFFTLYLFNLQKKIFWYKDFYQIWIGFMIFILEFYIINNIIYFLINNIAPNITNLIINIIITIITYPILHIVYFYLSNLLNKNNATKSI
jgi:rod shape-determining protein MreD